MTMTHRLLSRCIVTWSLLALVGGAVAAQGANPQPSDDPAAVPVWRKVHASVFQGRTILPAPAGMLQLDVPARATDAAVVPLAIRAAWPRSAPVQIAKVYLIIDANPSPISGIFQLAAVNGQVQLQTRVRVDGYSFVRAIVEASDGRLYGVTRFVKAAGGCSAPPGGDAALAAAHAGRMSLKLSSDPSGGTALVAQLSISHPNHSGLAMDQLTRQYTPAHYVRTVEVKQGGDVVFAADVDFSMSENPSFRFPFEPRGSEPLRVSVEDSQGRRFALDQASTVSAP